MNDRPTTGHDRPPDESSAAMGQAADALVHDLANLLQTLVLRADAAAALPGVPSGCMERLEQIGMEAQSGVEMLRALLETGRARVEALEPVDPVPFIDVALARRIPEVPLEIVPPVPRLRVHATELALLLDLLCRRLLRGAGRNTRLRADLRALQSDDPGGDDLPSPSLLGEAGWVQLRLVRDGYGDPVELQDGVLPRPTASGTIPDAQMELLRARGIVRRHRGLLRVEETVDDEAIRLTVRILLPVPAPR